MVPRSAVLALAVLLVSHALASAAPPKKPTAPKIPLASARCPVTSGKVDEKFETQYKGAKLFFADADALAAYQSAPARYTEKANLQLVATKQYEQAACPLTGRPLNKNFGIVIEGTPILVCCKNCVLMSAKARQEDQLKFFFSDQVFNRQYRPAPKESQER